MMRNTTKPTVWPGASLSARSGGGSCALDAFTSQFSPAKSCAVICVTAMLHNIAAKAGVALLEPEDAEDDDDEEDRCEDGLPHNYAAGFHARRRVIETFF